MSAKDCKRPLFITMEGGEGVGKTTQMRMLERRIKAAGFEVFITREPGDTLLGTEIRRMVSEVKDESPCPEAELLLYLADRAEHVRKVIRPALKKGKLVLCDRFADSSEVYQGRARGLGAEKVRELNKWVCGDVWPDLTLFLDMDPGEGLTRASQRQGWLGLDRLEQEGVTFHQAVRKGFVEQAAADASRIKIVPAQGKAEEVAERIWTLVKPVLQKWKNSEA
ncbi:dTMP kinase [Dethiosulfatarculus sandiegensis]|uniref:dTMP kinase n=1 Tax=Dethiosulfatarculus sandiegensis TaxID=1429043 RepID=UPI0005C84812|nr:dTMP kinase [Dethiosulfatarculus sandiegensis]